jgi:hypothetical protein
MSKKIKNKDQIFHIKEYLRIASEQYDVEKTPSTYNMAYSIEMITKALQRAMWLQMNIMHGCDCHKEIKEGD